MLGRKPIPLNLVKERRDYTISLKLIGLSVHTILKQINAKSADKGWGEVTLFTINHDIATYYRENKVLSPQEYDHLDQMRQALLSQMELNIEKMALHIRDTKHKWKAFEYAEALRKQHEMLMDYAELQNWNLGKQLNINIQQNNMTNIFDSAGVDLIDAPVAAVQELAQEIDKAIAKIKERDMKEKAIDVEVIS